MQCMSILGIGTINKISNDINVIWDQLQNENKLSIETDMIPFDSGIPLMKKKKANRYSEMGIYTSRLALEDSKIDLDIVNKERLGTVFTTGFGPLNSSIKFADSVANQDWEFCSPLVFANSVNNTCIGHICMTFGLKGVSTMLMASDNLTFSQLLLNQNKADYILTGALDEYCFELFEALTSRSNKISENVNFSEGAVALLVKKGYCADAYCNIKKIVQCSIDKYPLVEQIDKENAITQIGNLCNSIAEEDSDAFFGAGNGTYFDVIEAEAVKKYLSPNTAFVNNIKSIFGETLGASFNLNIMVAALCLKRGILPSLLDKNKRPVRKILVSGYDMAGNYMIAILKKS